MSFAQFLALVTVFFSRHPALAIDRDGDGYTRGIDCDDRDPAINPAATEIMNDGIDQDCSGTDGCGTSERRLHDVDGDGYGDPNNYEFVDVCDPWAPGLVNWTEGRDDCNDADADTHPGAVDVPNDGIDQDCNGVNACEFPITQADGSIVIMPTEVRLTLNSVTPYGSAVVGRSEVLRFRHKVQKRVPKNPIL